MIRVQEYVLIPDRKDDELNGWRESKELLARDPVVGFQKLQEQAALGSPLAMLETGRALALGIGVKEDSVQAEKWFRQVAQSKSILGHYYLARLFLRTKRFGEARDSLEFCAARGYAPALHDLGKIYYLGLGVTQDIAQAVRYLERASDGGSVFATRLLARILIKQARGPRDKLKGYKLFGSAFVQFVLALLQDGIRSERLLP